MKPLIGKAVVQGIGGLIFFVGLIYVTAGTWNYWQGWVFSAVFALSTTGFTVYMALYDRPLLERRMAPAHGTNKNWRSKSLSRSCSLRSLPSSFLPFLITDL